MLTAFFILYLLPLATHAAWWGSHNTAWSWSSANWSSSGILPPPAADRHAVVHVLAGRTGGWKGAFAHHTWLVLKPAGASRYTRYDVVGWGRPVRVDNWAPDGRWYSNTPAIVLTLNGDEAARAISRIERSVADYPFSNAGSYRVWPGPNSNSFIGHIAREVPELAPGLLPTAIGKDFTPDLLHVGLAPSATGVQVSIRACSASPSRGSKGWNYPSWEPSSASTSAVPRSSCRDGAASACRDIQKSLIASRFLRVRCSATKSSTKGVDLVRRAV